MSDLPYNQLGSLLDVADVDNSELQLDDYGPRLFENPPVPYAVCSVCGFIFSQNEMVKHNEKWYCRPNTCNDDILGIRMKKNPDAYFKNKSAGNRFYKGSGGRRL
jgi:hypothetical protein